MARKPRPKVLRSFDGGGNSDREAAGQDATEREQTILTPPEIVLSLKPSAGTLILDPATTPDNPLGALVWCCGPGLHGGCGLTLDWPAHPAGFTWLNMPFGSLRTWLEKCAAEGAKGARIWAIGPLRTHRNGIVPALATAAHCWSTRPVKFVGFESGFSQPCFMAGWNVPIPDYIDHDGRELRTGRLVLSSNLLEPL